MNCLKCGREIEDGQFFCEDCLIGMAKYPVKPGTAVQLPSRSVYAAPKKVHSHRRSKISPEDQLRVMRRRIRVLTILLTVCVILLFALAAPALRYFKEDHLLPGQNYSSVITTNAAGED